MKSKAIGRVKESFRNLFETLSNELRFPVRKSKGKTIEVSWPQSVVKTVEAGASIERPVEIQNAHQRLIVQHSRHSSTREGGAEIQEHGNATQNGVIDKRRRSGAVKFVDREDDVTARVDGGGRGIIDDTSTELENENCSSIYTASVRESMSEPRTSWRQSAPRMQATVSKVRPTKPQIQQVHPDITSINRLNPLAPKDSTPTPPHFRISNPSRIQQLPPERESSVVPHPHSPQPSAEPEVSTRNSEFLFPSAVAVRRDAWRYSVDAANACNKKRAENRYSLHGQGFVDLQPMKEVTDPEVLEKIAEIRRQEVVENDRKVKSKKVVSREFGTMAPGAPIGGNDEEIHHVNAQSHSQKHQGDGIHESRPTSNLKPPPTKAAIPATLIIPAFQPSYTLSNESPSAEASSVPVPHDHLHTPKHQSSSISSNIRTPKSYYGPNYEFTERIPVRVYPRINKVEESNRGRQNILDRWTAEKLQERRLEGRGLEIIEKNGRIWRTADVIFGKLKYGDGPPIIREIPPKQQNVRAPPVPFATNGVPLNSAGKFRKVPGVPQNSPANSSFGDLLSTSTYPRRIPEEAQHLPPPPSRAIVPYRRTVQPQTVDQNGNENNQHVNGINSDANPSTYSRQPGPWDIRDLIYPPKPLPLSSEDAKELLYKFIGRSLDPIHSAIREQRIHLSETHFPNSQPGNENFSSVTEMLEYITSSYQSVEREEIPPELTRINQVNILRLLITQELIPYPLIREELYPHLQLFTQAWPVARYLGLRPLGILHLIHEDVEIIIFLSTEDDAMYLWSHGWDENIYGGERKLIRAGRTIEECEVGILNQLHVLEFEEGGWLKLDGYNDETIREEGEQEFEDEDIYGNSTETGPMQI